MTASTTSEREPGGAAGSPARSLAEDLRRRDDAALASLLAARPDLARPAPADFVTLAARALSPASVRRALDGLDTPHLRTLEAAVVTAMRSGPASTSVPVSMTDDVARLLACTPGEAAGRLDRLHDAALLWRDDTGHHVPRAVAEILEPVAGLAPPHENDRSVTPAVGQRTATPSAEEPAAPPPGAEPSEAPPVEGRAKRASRDDALRDDITESTPLSHLLESAPAGATALLDRLTWGPPTGVLDPSGPVAETSRWLVDHGVLRQGDGGPGTVVLPRPVALALRDGRLHRDVPDPGLAVAAHDVDRIDAAAGARAADVLGLVDEIADAVGSAPPRVLRAGGLAVRDLQELAARLGATIPETSLLLEVMRGARLIRDDGAALDPVWAPTRHYDDWIATDDDLRWADLALTWRDLPRAPHRVGSRGRSGPVNVWSNDVALPGVIEARRHALSVLASVEPGGGVAAEDVAHRMRWERPRRPAAFLTELATATTVEADLLGVSAAGALSTAGHRLLDPLVDAADLAAQVRLPPAVDQVLLQADLTAVVPGRPSRALGSFLRRAADVESRGGATTFRFSTSSIERILDDGWDADTVLSTLETSSPTPVPQPLTYLVTDAARRHGRALVGTATSYLRSEDPAALDALLASPEAAPARLRRIAPTVLVSPVPPTKLLDLLRRVGMSALAEGMDGTVVTGAAAPARAATPRDTRAAATQSVDAGSIVAALRAAEGSAPAHSVEAAGSDGVSRIPSTDPSVTVAVLREAASSGGEVWIGVVDAAGAMSRLRIRPTRVAGGLVHVVDPHSGRARQHPLSRITGVLDAPPGLG